jgi:hypothetical protein
MHYLDKQEAKVNIMYKLVDAGWQVFGHKHDESDSMVDYYSPARWSGVATKNGYVLLIDVYNLSLSALEVRKYDYNKQSYVANSRIEKLKAMMNDAASTENEKASCAVLIEKEMEKANVEPSYTVIETYPTFAFANPKGASWHIEKDGQIIAKGNGVYATNTYDWENKEKSATQQKEVKIASLVKRIEKALIDADALKPETVKVPVKTMQAVERSVSEVVEADIKEGFTFVMKVGYTHGASKENRYTLIHNDQQFNKYHTFAKLGKNNKPSKSIDKSWSLSVDRINELLSKGHIAIVEFVEVTEYVEKIVYKKTTRKQTVSDVPAIETSGELQQPEQPQEQSQTNNLDSGNITSDQATKRQLWAIHVATKLNTTKLVISKAQATELIAKSKVGQSIKEEVETLLNAQNSDSNQSAAERDENTQQSTQDTLSPYECGVLAFHKGLKCVPAWDQEFLNTHIAGLQVGEGLPLYDEWLKGWTFANLEAPVNYNSDTTNEQQENYNVIYRDFNNSNNNEEEANINTTFDDLLSKFDNVEVTADSKVSADDLEFCQEQETNYKALIMTYEGFYDELNKISCSTFYGVMSSYDYKDSLEKIKESFIKNICYHFINKYKVTINHEKIINKLNFESGFQDVLDNIFIQLDGYSFSEKAEKEIKDNSKEMFKYGDKVSIKGNKLVLDGYFSHLDSIWKEYRLSESKVNKIFQSLQLFDSGSIMENEELKNKYCGYDNSKKLENYERYTTQTLKKAKSIKFFKNGKLEIEFIGNQEATTFASEYCGYKKVAV